MRRSGSHSPLSTLAGRRAGRAAALLPLALLAPACGHTVRSELAPNHEGRFDFSDPPCAAAGAPATPGHEAVVVRYLGTGGLFIGWGEDALLTGPFFSNPGLLRVGFGRVRWDRDAIQDGLAGLPLDRVRAILVGHSHYDHLGDLPVVARDHAPGAELWVNRSGARMLAGCSGLSGRLRTLEDHEGQWVWLPGADGGPSPIRFMPLRSEHAPHFDRVRWADGEVEEAWKGCLDRHPVRRLLQGRTHAFVIDLMAEDREEVRFRIYYVDAAASAPAGFPPADLAGERPFDLAALCVPSHHLAEGYPEGLLRLLRPRHVLAIHYEDFFRPRSRPVRFVPLLTDRRANRFLEKVRDGLAEGGQAAAGPIGPVCGPSSAGWTMPLPREWVLFGVRTAPP